MVGGNESDIGNCNMKPKSVGRLSTPSVSKLANKEEFTTASLNFRASCKMNSAIHARGIWPRNLYSPVHSNFSGRWATSKSITIN